MFVFYRFDSNAFSSWISVKSIKCDRKNHPNVNATIFNYFQRFYKKTRICSLQKFYFINWKCGRTKKNAAQFHRTQHIHKYTSQRYFQFRLYNCGSFTGFAAFRVYKLKACKKRSKANLIVVECYNTYPRHVFVCPFRTIQKLSAIHSKQYSNFIENCIFSFFSFIFPLLTYQLIEK